MGILLALGAALSVLRNWDSPAHRQKLYSVPFWADYFIVLVALCPYTWFVSYAINNAISSGEADNLMFSLISLIPFTIGVGLGIEVHAENFVSRASQHGLKEPGGKI